MLDLFKYTHFGPYLHDWFEAQKIADRSVTLQSVSSSLGLKSRSLFHRLMNDPKASISLSLSEAISDLIGHNKGEREYFQSFVLFGRARSPGEKGKLYARMHRLLERLRPQYLEHWQLDLFKNWYTPAICELLNCKLPLKTPEEIAKRLCPAITPTQARGALECLLKLGLIKPRAGGNGWKVTQKVFDAPPDLDSAAVVAYQSQMLDRAKRALETQELGEREILATTFSMPSEHLEHIRTLIRNFQNELTRELLSLNGSHDRVYQFNLQLFPISNQDHK